jgi:D-glycero-beta-D-manno-heptose-7-phosphate kinase
VTAPNPRLRDLVGRLAGRRLAILGDAILDEYLVGQPSRISREAPVLVLEFSQRFCRAGGAANPAVNVQALGAQAELIALIGDDTFGQALTAELTAAGLSTAGLVVWPGAQTAAKTRLLAEDAASRQHLARLDYPASRPEPAARAALGQRLQAAAGQAEALLLSDYRAGVLDPASIDLARQLGRQHGLLTTVDSQGDLLQFSGFDLVKCNLAEAERALGRPLPDQSAVEQAGLELLERLASRFVVVTRGPAGLSAFERGQPPAHLPAANRTEVFDVTGAGDTVIALLTLALVAGATLLEAAELANLAAGLVVRRLGVATTSPAELLAAL